MKESMFALVFLSVCSVFADASVRYEAISVDRPVVATGTEVVGQLDGSSSSLWDTTKVADGWQVLSSGETDVDVLVLNEPAVMGGRLAANETWTVDRLRVLCSDIVIPNGVTLTLAAGCVVKFLPGARFVVENGGALRAEGAIHADFADDTVAGDTNHDDATTRPSGVEWWLEDPSAAELATLEFFDGAAAVSPKRSYTIGVNYGSLPTLAKDGMVFRGWSTEPEGAGTKVDSGMLASKSVARVYAAWEVLSIALTPESTNVDAAGGTYSFAVAANGSWSAQSDSDWVSVLEGKGTGDSSVRFSVGANAATQGRSATIHVALSDGVTVRDFTIRQSAMSSLATPVISPADGTMFSGSTRRVAIGCATADATIRYTLDGSEPDETSILYKNKSFNLKTAVETYRRSGI